MSDREKNSSPLAHVLALVASAMSVAAVFAFARRMASQKKVWEEFGTELTRWEVTQVRFADFWTNYWYLLAPIWFLVTYFVTLGLARSSLGADTRASDK